MSSKAIKNQLSLEKAISFCIFLFVLFSCREQAQKEANTAATGSGKDSINRQAEIFTGDSATYTVKVKLELKNFDVSVRSKYNVDTTGGESSSTFDGNYLFVRDKKNNQTDTLKLESSDEELTDLAIQDLTDNLHFKKLFLNLSWRGDSDAPWNELAGYQGDSLKSFVVIYSLQSLHRKDEFTLTGFTGGRDEVVSNFQYDYPITISLKDYSVSEEQPAKQYIGYSTTTLETINAYRMRGPKDSVLYTIKKETEVRVDTFYRRKGIVRLIIADSIIVHIKLKTAQEKLQSNAAG